MSEFEVADLFASYLSITVTFFMAFVSVTSAMLVASYFASNVIPTRLATVVIFIYTISSIFLIGGFQRNSQVLETLRAQIAPWHTASSEPAWILPTITAIGTLTLVFISISAVWYFQYSRKNKTN